MATEVGNSSEIRARTARSSNSKGLEVGRAPGRSVAGSCVPC